VVIPLTRTAHPIAQGAGAQATGSRWGCRSITAQRDCLETRFAHFAQLLAQSRSPDTLQGRQAEKIRQRLVKQQDHLLTFLDYSEVDATNHLAERQLRPAVISRQLSCGDKTLDQHRFPRLLDGQVPRSRLALLHLSFLESRDHFFAQLLKFR